MVGLLARRVSVNTDSPGVGSQLSRSFLYSLILGSKRSRPKARTPWHADEPKKTTKCRGLQPPHTLELRGDAQQSKETFKPKELVRNHPTAASYGFKPKRERSVPRAGMDK